MLTVTTNRTIPSDLDARAEPQETVTILRSAPKHYRVMTCFRIRTPNQKASVDTAHRGMIEHIEKAAPIGKQEVPSKESNCHPDAVSRTVNGIAYTLEENTGVNQRLDFVAVSYWIRP